MDTILIVITVVVCLTLLTQVLGFLVLMGINNQFQDLRISVAADHTAMISWMNGAKQDFIEQRKLLTEFVISLNHLINATDSIADTMSFTDTPPPGDKLMFGGMSSDDVIDQMKAQGYELSSDDVSQLRKLFEEVVDDDDDDLDDATEI
jgi:hypothetical protein